ncbi:MAG: phosphate ABC transporter substrate-binding protein [Opitutales bacterium]
MLSFLRHTPRFFFFFLALLSASHGAFAETVRITGSTTVNPVVADAAEQLRDTSGLRIRIDTAGGSSGGINALGDGRAEIAMSSRQLNASDQRKFPDVDFHAVRIGEDAISIVVSRDVWESGVRSITPAQMRGIYEGTHTNWKQLGGEDRRIVFFNKEPGRGTWEVFVKWLYGDKAKAPRVSHPEVGANAEVRSKVGRTRGALSFVSTPWVDDTSLFALSIQEGDELIAPTPSAIASHRYPLSRPLFLITAGTPRGDAKAVIDYLLSDQGQAIVARHGYLKLDQLRE